MEADQSIDFTSRYVNALRTQGKSRSVRAGTVLCPYPGHGGRMFRNIDHLYDHAKSEHISQIAGLAPDEARRQLRQAVLESRKTKCVADNEFMPQGSSSPGKKRPVDTEGHGRRGKPTFPVEVVDPDYSGELDPQKSPIQRKPDLPPPQPFDSQNSRVSDLRQPPSTSHASPHRPKPEWSQSHFPNKTTPRQKASEREDLQRQQSLMDLPIHDPRYPNLLLQPDSRPISREQLATEVKSIYAGLTMVETKCIHVERAYNKPAPLKKARKLRKYSDKPTMGSDTFVSNTVFEIPGIVAQEHAVDALGDTGAKYNFMREEYAMQTGLPIQRDETRSVAITKNHNVTTTGTAEACFSFKGEEEQHSVVFHLLPDCLHDVILGNVFLKVTKTLTSFASRIKKRVVENLSQYNLLYLGESAPRFSGYLNGRPQEALADTGAKVLVMDEDYARSIGLQIDKSRRVKLRFGDNSTAYTSGMTYGVEWEFGQVSTKERVYEEEISNEYLYDIDLEVREEGEDNDLAPSYHEMYEAQHVLDFHIMKDAPANVILSDEFLFSTNAFSEYDCFLLEDEKPSLDDDDDAYLFVIDRDMSYVNKSSVRSAAARQYYEDVRRTEVDDCIADLPTAEKAAARAAEDERRARWDAQNVGVNIRPGAAGPGDPVPLLQNSGTGNGGRTASKSPWRYFKFKRKKDLAP